MIHYGNVAGFIYRTQQQEQPKQEQQPKQEPEPENEDLQRFKQLCATKMKRCSRCGEELPPECFYRNKGNSGGLNYHCKACEAEYKRRRRELARKRKEEGVGAE
jgi:hypothetical protein